MKAICLWFFLLFPMLLAGQSPKTAEVKTFNGKPTLFVNNKVVAPDFYALTHAYGARWSWEEVPQRNLKNFCEIGFRLYQLDLYFEDIWYKNIDTLDIGKARRQVKGLLDVCPDAGIVIRIHVNAPYWWNEANRSECTEYGDGPVDDRSYGPPFNNEDGDVNRPLRASLASLKWRQESGQRLAEFCKRMADTPEGKSVIGIHVSGGVYGEWHNWGFIDHDPDLGLPMTNYFRKWLKNKYTTDQLLQKSWKNSDYSLSSATVPGSAERNVTTDGIFRNPQKEQRVIDYFTAQQQVVAEDIEHFCKIVKDNWPRHLIVGVFYGYFHMTFCRQASGGHLFIERILNCPYIDYLAAPQSYWGETRGLGGSGNSRMVIESAMLHGKLCLDEVDNGGLQNNSAIDEVRNKGNYDPNYVPVISRSAIYPLMRGAGLWYYDFGPRNSFGWWDNPVYLKNIKAEKEFFEKKASQPFQSMADALVVWDQESFYHVKNGWTPICYNIIDQAFEESLHAGVACDHIYLFDLDRVDLKKYKAVMFMNTYKMTAIQREFIRKKVASEGRTLIFNYLPGYTDGFKNNIAFVKEVTGFSITSVVSSKTPNVIVKNPGLLYKMESAVNPMVLIIDPTSETLSELADTSGVVMARKTEKNSFTVFSTLPIHGADVFRELFSKAGCHVYNMANDFTYACNGMILIHSKDGGRRQITLPGNKKIELEVSKATTLLLDAKTGGIILHSAMKQ